MTTVGLKKKRSLAPEEEAYVSLLRTADMLARGVETLLKPSGISPTQYNVLRILRGSPQGLPCREISSRMISRDPDITRLLNRLEKASLITRCREDKDRRIVLTQITGKGLRLLAKLDSPIGELHRKQLSHLGQERLRVFMQLLEEAGRRPG